jgi:peptidoglycan/xylan/chitin deacetylase (PgdA/CDA1 family)
MNIVKNVAKNLLHNMGGIQGFRLANSRGIRILMYHRFPPDPPGLRQQCEIIKRDYTPVSLKSISEYLRGGDPLPRNAVAITVDDGYRDFLWAHPVFREYDLPTTVFLVSDFLDGKLWLWFDQIKYALRQTRKQSFTLELPGEGILTLALSSDQERTLAREKISERLKRVEDSCRLEGCKQVINQLEVDIPSVPPDEFAPFEWSEVRKLANEGVEFGAHTRTHPILSRIEDLARQHEEIEGSKRRLDEELGIPTIHFCYPNGTPADFNDATLKFVADCGFHSAVTTERGMNFRKSHPFLLRRLGVEPTIPIDYFHELLAGVRRE